MIEASPEPVGNAYKCMERPPEFELYDLEADPFEFSNLADNLEYAETLARLKKKLLDWRKATDDPMLKKDNILHLKREIDACVTDGKYNKKELTLTYPDYSFGKDSLAPAMSSSEEPKKKVEKQ